MKKKIEIQLKKICDKIKPWLKTKRAWFEIVLSIVAIIFIILAIACFPKNAYQGEDIQNTVKPTKEADIDTTVTPTLSPAATALAATAQPSEASDNSSSVDLENDPSVPDETISSSTYTGPTGAPLYTAIPDESVSTRANAYRSIVQSCKGDADKSVYYLYDMDSDGVEELIINSYYDELSATIDVYTYSDEGLLFLGDASGCFATVCGCSDGGIIIYYRRDGAESIERRRKDGSELLADSIVPNAFVEEYTVLDTNIDIPAYGIDDLSPIN